jgi:hypothetical protein
MSRWKVTSPKGRASGSRISVDLVLGFRREVDICVLLGCYTAYIGNSLPTLRVNLSVPSSIVKIAKHSWPVMGPIGCSATSVRNWQYTLCNNPEERRSLTFIDSKRRHCGSEWSALSLGCFIPLEIETVIPVEQGFGRSHSVWKSTFIFHKKFQSGWPDETGYAMNMTSLEH